MNKYLRKYFIYCCILFGLQASAQNFPDEMHLSSNGRRLITGNLPYTGFYDQSVIHDIYLDFSDPGYWNDLEDNYGSDIDIMATMTIDGTVFDSVGVRFKGASSYTGSNDYKKSFNISLNEFVPGQDIDGYNTLNLNNCMGDPSFMAEIFYEYQISKHVPAPKGNFAHLFINGMDWGIYANVQQLNKDFLKEWFQNNNGDLWRAKRPPGSPAHNGVAGDSLRSLYFLGTDTTIYTENYYLKSGDVSYPYTKLMTMTQVMDTVSQVNMESVLGDYLDIDQALWFIASEDAFGDDDGYVFEGRSDYYIYLDEVTGRIIPLEFDGNGAMDPSYEHLNIFSHANKPNYALLYKLLNNPPLRQRYLAHMRTLVADELDVASDFDMIDNFYSMIDPIVQNDPVSNYSYSDFVNHQDVLKHFVSERRDYILSNSEIDEDLPVISNTTFYSGSTAWQAPMDNQDVYVTSNATSPDGIDKVTLYFATGLFGKFSKATMRDDGNHHDGAAGDGIFGATIPGEAVGTWVRFYIEATSDNTAKTVTYDPVGAEHDIYTYMVRPAQATNTSVVINELMASNTVTMADNAGEFDDWLELFNKSNHSVDLSGYVLTDNSYNLTKWEFPQGTIIPAHDYLIIWLDEDGSQGDNHANFKLSSGGEHLMLLDANHELVDEVTFGNQITDKGYARVPNGTGGFVIQNPTFDNNNNPAPQAIFTTSATAGCAPFALTLSNHSTLANTYYWDFGDGTTSAAISPSHNYTLAGTYTVKLIASISVFSDTDSVSITVNPVAQAPLTFPGFNCGPGNVTLFANSADTIQWFDAPSGGNLIGTGDSILLTSLNATTIVYALPLATCPGNAVPDTAYIFQLHTPTTISAFHCGQGDVTLIANSPDSLSWYDAPIAGNLLGTGDSLTLTSLTNTMVVYVRPIATCPVTVPDTAFIFSLPVFDFGMDTIHTTTVNYLLGADPGFDSYSWSSGESTQAISVDNSGLYCVIVTDANTCSDSDCVYVILNTLEVENLSNKNLNLIFPNPANDYVRIIPNENSVLPIEIFDYTGRALFCEKISQDTRIETANWAEGVYFVRAGYNAFSLLIIH